MLILFKCASEDSWGSRGLQVLIGLGCLVSSCFGALGFGFGLRGFGLWALGLRGFMASGSRWTRAFIQVMGVMI